MKYKIALLSRVLWYEGVEFMINFDGVEYKSYYKLCQVYGVPDSTFYNRLAQGYTVKQSLGLEFVNPVVFRDKEFKNYAELCKYYNVDKNLFRSRFYDCSWTLEEALGLTIRRYPLCKPVMYKGKIYDNLGHLCREYGIEKHTIRNRLKIGWTLEDAVIVPVRHRKKSIKKI